MYPLDTVVLSELRKRQRNPNVVAWVRSVRPEDLFLSTVTIGEVELGIEKQKPVNPTFADELSRWLERTLRIYGDRILPLDVEGADAGVGLPRRSATTASTSRSPPRHWKTASRSQRETSRILSRRAFRSMILSSRRLAGRITLGRADPFRLPINLSATRSARSPNGYW